ncbi:MAG: 16S rRNA (uracil(1498)-N(3))-methyltransferase [Cytophagaceae bacterium]
MQVFYSSDISGELNTLSEEESKHCINVLRHKKDDVISVTDGKGNLYKAKIEEAHPKRCAFSVLEKTTSLEKSYSIHIGFSPTKNIDRTEWFLEKCIELGVDKVSFLLCHHSERKHINPERLQRLAISALKQSLNLRLPELSDMSSFQDFIHSFSGENGFIAYVDQENNKHLFNEAPKSSNYTILIGPEGDFSPEEVKMALHKGFKAVSLGKSRLRTETAGVVACHCLNLVNEIP